MVMERTKVPHEESIVLTTSSRDLIDGCDQGLLRETQLGEVSGGRTDDIVQPRHFFGDDRGGRAHIPVIQR